MMWFLLGILAGFVAGVLFGRRNTKKVEAALTELKKRYENEQQPKRAVVRAKSVKEDTLH